MERSPSIWIDDVGLDEEEALPASPSSEPHWLWALIAAEDSPPSEVWEHCHAESPPVGALVLRAAGPLKEAAPRVRFRGTRATPDTFRDAVRHTNLPMLRGLLGAVADVAASRRSALHRLRNALSRNDTADALVQARLLVGLSEG